MRTELVDDVEEREITDNAWSVTAQAISQVNRLLHNRKIAIRLKEKQDLEHKLQMANYAEDIRDAQNTVESYIAKYPDSTKAHQEWLQSRRSEIQRAMEIEA